MLKSSKHSKETAAQCKNTREILESRLPEWVGDLVARILGFGSILAILAFMVWGQIR